MVVPMRFYKCITCRYSVILELVGLGEWGGWYIDDAGCPADSARDLRVRIIMCSSSVRCSISPPFTHLTRSTLEN